jgi:hypothetical protein
MHGKPCWYCGRVQPPHPEARELLRRITPEEFMRKYVDEENGINQGCVRGEADYQHCVTHDDVFSRVANRCSRVLVYENKRLRYIIENGE